MDEDTRYYIEKLIASGDYARARHELRSLARRDSQALEMLRHLDEIAPQQLIHISGENRLLANQETIRPTCITIYVLFVSAVLILLCIGLCLASASPSLQAGSEEDIIATLSLLVIVPLNVASLIGLWNMESWGRYLTLILCLMSVVGGICSGYWLSAIFYGIVGIWLFQNDHLFH